MTTANRLGWTVVGILLLAAGVAGVLAHLGQLPGVAPSSRLLPSGVDSTVRGWGTLGLAIGIAAGLLLVSLGLLLLLAELPHRRPGPGELSISGTRQPEAPRHAADAQPTRGLTHIAAATLTKALSQDIGRTRGVESAHADLIGTVTEPQLVLRLTVGPDLDAARIRALVDRAVDRFSTTSGIRPSLADVEVTGSHGRPHRVH